MLWGDLFHHTRIPAHSLRNTWKRALCVSRWCGGLGCRIRKQMGETFCLVCAALARSGRGTNLGSDALLKGAKPLEASDNVVIDFLLCYWHVHQSPSSAGLSVPESSVCKTPRSLRDHCLEKSITAKNSSLLCESVGLWGLCILPHGSGRLPLTAAEFAAVSRVACSVKRHLLCWAPDGMKHWNRGLRLGCGNTAVWGPAVCLGNTFPSYSFGWNLVLENASLK